MLVSGQTIWVVVSSFVLILALYQFFERQVLENNMRLFQLCFQCVQLLKGVIFFFIFDCRSIFLFFF